MSTISMQLPLNTERIFPGSRELMTGIANRTLYGKRKQKITDVCCSTRRVTKNCAFVCIRGEYADGHDYRKEAIEKGARFLVVERLSSEHRKALTDWFEQAYPMERLVICQVADSRKAYALMCRNFFGRPDEALIMIGVTGTKGKTTTAFLIRGLLQKQVRTGLIGTNGAFLEGEYYPTEHTTPDAYAFYELLARMKRRGISHVVMEISSQGLKQHRIYGTRFHLGIYTNFSKDHIGPGEHASLEEYAFWKNTFPAYCDRFLYNADDAQAALSGRHAINSYGYSSKNGGFPEYFDIEWENIPKDRAFGAWMTLYDKAAGGREHFYVPGAYDFYRDDVLAALSAVALCGMDPFSCAEALAVIEIPGRMQMVYSSPELRVIIDYAHNEESLRRVLCALRTFRPKRLVVLFGCGGERSVERRLGMGRIAGTYADLSIITEDNSRREAVGDIMKDILRGVQETKGRFLVIPDRKEAIRYVIRDYEKGDLILLAGKGHEQYMLRAEGKTVFSEKEIVREELKRMGLI